MAGRHEKRDESTVARWGDIDVGDVKPKRVPFTREQHDIVVDTISVHGVSDAAFQRAAARSGRYMYECREEWTRYLGANHNPNHPAANRGRGRGRARPSTDEFDG